MKKIKITCKKCSDKYEFYNRWLIKNDPKEFVCRRCKIIETTQSNKFREESRKRSLEKLSDEITKSKMSIIATINNAKNATKISESLRKFYKDSKNKSNSSKNIKKLWRTKNYRDKIINKIREKWRQDDYRSKVLSSKDRTDITIKFNSKEHNSLKNKLIKNNIKFEENFYLGVHKFDFLINDEIIIDLESNNTKKLFAEHYFKQYKYQTKL